MFNNNVVPLEFESLIYIIAAVHYQHISWESVMQKSKPCSYDSGDLRGVAGGDGELEGVCVVRQAPVICVMAPPHSSGCVVNAMAAF